MDCSKEFISTSELRKLSVELFGKITADSWRPTVVVGVARGGLAPAVYIHELLERKQETKFRCVSAKSYTGIGEQSATLTVIGLEDILRSLEVNTEKILIVDDIFDTGKTINTILNICAGLDMCLDVRSAVLFYKPSKNQTNITPTYYCRETDKWVVFPHEVDGLSDDEVSKHYPEAASELVKKSK